MTPRLPADVDYLGWGWNQIAFLDRTGAWWFASGRGILRYPPGMSLEQLATAMPERITGLDVFRLFEDSHGDVWISAFGAAALRRWERASGTIRAWPDEVWHQRGVPSAFAEDRSGTPQGLSRLQPGEDWRLPTPAVWITRLRVAGVGRPLPRSGVRSLSGLVLDHDHVSIEISFTAPSFASGPRLRFEHRVLPASPGWSEPSEGRSLHLVGLAPGQYQVELRAATVSEDRNAPPATITFTIRPPFWRRWWFLALVGAAAVATAYGAHRLRLERAVAAERLRTRIAADLHDDLGASLSRISILSEVARRELERGTADGARLRQIGTIARRLVDDTRDIVWSINPGHDDLASLLVRVREFASDVLDGSGVSWRLEAPPELPRAHLDPGQRRQLLLVLKEAVTNLARHSGASNATIHVDVGRGRLRVEVQDDGCGFSPPSDARPGTGNGLRNMAARIADLGGELRLESAPGQGTVVRLEVPLR